MDCVQSAARDAHAEQDPAYAQGAILVQPTMANHYLPSPTDNGWPYYMTKLLDEAAAGGATADNLSPQLTGPIIK